MQGGRAAAQCSHLIQSFIHLSASMEPDTSAPCAYIPSSCPAKSVCCRCRHTHLTDLACPPRIGPAWALHSKFTQRLTSAVLADFLTMLPCPCKGHRSRHMCAEHLRDSLCRDGCSHLDGQAALQQDQLLLLLPSWLPPSWLSLRQPVAAGLFCYQKPPDHALGH